MSVSKVLAPIAIIMKVVSSGTGGPIKLLVIVLQLAGWELGNCFQEHSSCLHDDKKVF